MNETQFKCFFYACECLNFTEAAIRAHITQPALSRNIARLEDELGFALFIRDSRTRSVRLSSAGSVFYEGLRVLKGQFGDLVAKSEKADRGESGTLSLGILDDELIDESLQKAIYEFGSLYPDVELNMQRAGYQGLVEGLYKKTFDIIFTVVVEVHNRPGIVYDDMYFMETRLAIHRDHPLAFQENLSLADFKDETFIIFPDQVAGRLNERLFEACNKAGFIPNTIIAPDLKTQLLWIEVGRGIAGVSAHGHIANSPLVKMVKLPDMSNLMYVRAWEMENFNPAIALFNSVMDQ
jgi:DNA-binding transcriptional LysR family regulator